MERNRTRARLYKQNKETTPEELERRRQYGKEYYKKKREQFKLSKNEEMCVSSDESLSPECNTH